MLDPDPVADALGPVCLCVYGYSYQYTLFALKDHHLCPRQNALINY